MVTLLSLCRKRWFLPLHMLCLLFERHLLLLLPLLRTHALVVGVRQFTMLLSLATAICFSAVKENTVGCLTSK